MKRASRTVYGAEHPAHHHPAPGAPLDDEARAVRIFAIAVMVALGVIAGWKVGRWIFHSKPSPAPAYAAPGNTPGTTPVTDTTTEGTDR